MLLDRLQPSKSKKPILTTNGGKEWAQCKVNNTPRHYNIPNKRDF